MNSFAHHVLIIEDEAPIRRFLKATLQNEGYRVSEASSGQEGLRHAMSQPPDIVLLDLGLPDGDGRDILTRLREWFTAPIVILTARDQEDQKIWALDNGADDYVTKPFSLGELLARMRTALRHANRNVPDAFEIRMGDVVVDFAARLVTKKGEIVHLTPLEYKLFSTMLKHAGKVLTHRYLLREVWGPQDSHENHYLRVFVASLRKKLEDEPSRPRHFLTEQGVGYRLSIESA